MNANSPALEAVGLSKSFGPYRAVHNASVTLGADEVVAVIGPNGAGKTTLFDLLTGRKTADSGSIRIFGQDATSLPPWRRVRLGLSRSFQVSSVFPTFTAAENIQIGILLARRKAWNFWGFASHIYRREAEILLEQVGLQDRRDELAGQLSHGDQRSLELGVTLSSRPRVLLLDEPTAGMGIAETEECLARIGAIARAERLPVLFVEHDMKVVFSFATRIVVLAAGEVLTSGSPDQIRADERVKEVYFGDSL